MAADDWKRELSEIVFGRLPIIVWTTLCVAGLSLVLAFFSTPTHVARGH